MKVHWLTQKWEQVPESSDWLHPTEQEYFKRFKFQKKQQDWLLGRWTSKQAILEYFNGLGKVILPEDIAILPAEDGAPEICYQGKNIDCFISLSHSHGTGMCAITLPEFRIGCDLEKIEPRSPEFITDYFTEEEQRLILNNDTSLTPLLANLIWSAKESVVKALRTGLSVDTRKVRINCTPAVNQGEWNELEIFHSGLEYGLYGYWQWSDGYVMTIVGDHSDIEVHEMEM